MGVSVHKVNQDTPRRLKIGFARQQAWDAVLLHGVCELAQLLASIVVDGCMPTVML